MQTIVKLLFFLLLSVEDTKALQRAADAKALQLQVMYGFYRSGTKITHIKKGFKGNFIEGRFEVVNYSSVLSISDNSLQIEFQLVEKGFAVSSFSTFRHYIYIGESPLKSKLYGITNIDGKVSLVLPYYAEDGHPFKNAEIYIALKSEKTPLLKIKKKDK